MKIKLNKTTLNEIMLNLIKDKLQLKHELDEKNFKILALENEIKVLNSKIA